MSPEVTTALQTLYDLLEDTNLEICIQVQGYPEPRLSIFKNDTKLKLNERCQLGKLFYLLYKVEHSSIFMRAKSKFLCLHFFFKLSGQAIYGIIRRPYLLLSNQIYEIAMISIFRAVRADNISADFVPLGETKLILTD